MCTIAVYSEKFYNQNQYAWQCKSGMKATAGTVGCAENMYVICTYILFRAIFRGRREGYAEQYGRTAFYANASLR